MADFVPKMKSQTGYGFLCPLRGWGRVQVHGKRDRHEHDSSGVD